MVRGREYGRKGGIRRTELTSRGLLDEREKGRECCWKGGMLGR